MASVISSSLRPDGGNGAHRFVDQRGEEIDADECEVRRGIGGLLDEAHDVAVYVELGDAEVAGVLHVGEQDLGGGRLAWFAELGGPAARFEETVDPRAQIVLEHVVAEVHDELVFAEELARDQDAVRQPARRVLVDVGDLDPEPRPVAHGRPDLGTGLADLDDDADFLDARRRELLDPVEDDRLVRDRYELLRARVRNGTKSRAGATGEDQALHP